MIVLLLLLLFPSIKAIEQPIEQPDISVYGSPAIDQPEMYDPITGMAVAKDSTIVTARIYGTIYDKTLKRVEDVIVQINTTPTQRFIAKQGTYSFEIPVGNYLVTVYREEEDNLTYYVMENITVPAVGTFLVDLYSKEAITVRTEEPPPQETPPEKQQSEWQRIFQILKQNSLIFYPAIIILALLIIIGGYFIYRQFHLSKKIEGELYRVKEDNIKLREEQQQKELEESIHRKDLRPELKQVVDIIIKQGNRTTQKELRREIPLSEAKISLMVSELVELGILKKIKKGRGNIVILEAGEKEKQ